jgi:calcineurin-like phosphoesterase family protein
MKKFLKEGGFTVFNKILITSDLHFRHDNVIKFEPIRSELQKAENFVGTPDEYLIYKWNQQVNENDLVVNLGDLHWKSYEPIADKLNGKMLLVLGNHDMKPQYYQKYNNIYAVEGIWNLNGIPSEYFINQEKEDKLLSGFILGDVLFSHYPISDEAMEEETSTNEKIKERMKILQKISIDAGCTSNVHGHLHSKNIQTPGSRNVCIDFNKYKILDFLEVYQSVS